MAKKWCSIFSLALLASFLVRKVSATNHDMFCNDLKPQNSLDINQMMGMWYGVEVISHSKQEEGSYVYYSCPVIHLSETTYEVTTDPSLRPGDYGFVWTEPKVYGPYNYGEREFRNLRLYWDENGNNIEYTLKFNATRKGLWMSTQNVFSGTAVNQRAYNQFGGTIQVIKFVEDHLVLTFCQSLPESNIFTVILSREPQQLGKQVIHSIHNQLDRRHLSTSEVRKVCNGAISIDMSFGNLAALIFVSLTAYFKSGMI